VAQHRALQRLRRELEERAARRGVTADAPSAAPAQDAPVRLSVRRPRTARRIAPARPQIVVGPIALAPRIPAQRVAEEPVAVAV
jgi:hypothetical protein